MIHNRRHRGHPVLHLHLPPGQLQGHQVIVRLLHAQEARQVLLGHPQRRRQVAPRRRATTDTTRRRRRRCRRYLILLVVVRPGPVELGPPADLGLLGSGYLERRYHRQRRGWRGIVDACRRAADAAALVVAVTRPFGLVAERRVRVVVVRVRGRDVVGLALRARVVLVQVIGTLALALAGRLAVLPEALGERVVLDLQLRYVVVLEKGRDAVISDGFRSVMRVDERARGLFGHI